MPELFFKLRSRHMSILVVATALVLIASGCGKETGATTTNTPSETPAPQQVNHAVSTPAPPSPVAAPADARLAESQAAIKAQDYEKAATTLVNLQRSQLSAQQAEAVAAQMRQLQGGLAAGIANGDARAKAAADKLRQSATVR